MHSIVVNNKRFYYGCIYYKKGSLRQRITNSLRCRKYRKAFVAEGYEVHVDNLAKGEEIYITKGGLFKAALGLRSALKVSMKPSKDGNIYFKAGISVLKQQFVPTVITMCFFSPVVIAQIWGMIKQSKLDEKAVAIAERALYQTGTIF